MSCVRRLPMMFDVTILRQRRKGEAPDAQIRIGRPMLNLPGLRDVLARLLPTFEIATA